MLRATELTVNDEVERVRRQVSLNIEINFDNNSVCYLFCRAHLNDMENILPYLSIGLFYVLTDPNPMVATILYRVATVARFLHTFVYAIYVVPQPARGLSFGIHFFITLYMAFMCIIYFI